MLDIINVWKWLIKIIIISLKFYHMLRRRIKEVFQEVFSRDKNKLHLGSFQMISLFKFKQVKSSNTPIIPMFKWRRCASITNMQLIFKIIFYAMFQSSFVFFFALLFFFAVVCNYWQLTYANTCCIFLHLVYFFDWKFIHCIFGEPTKAGFFRLIIKTP